MYPKLRSSPKKKTHSGVSSFLFIGRDFSDAALVAVDGKSFYLTGIIDSRTGHIIRTHSGVSSFFACFKRSDQMQILRIPDTQPHLHGDLATVSRTFCHTVTEQSHIGQRGCHTPPTFSSGFIPAGYNLSRLLINVLLGPFIVIIRLLRE